MNKNILYLTLGGLVVLGVGIAIGSRINHHFAPRAYHCSDCGRFGDEFICSSCNKTIIDFRSLEQPFPPCNSPVYMPQLPRHHRDGMAPRPHHHSPEWEKRPAVKVLGNERPVNVRTGLPEIPSPEKYEMPKTPNPFRHPIKIRRLRRQFRLNNIQTLRTGAFFYTQSKIPCILPDLH